MSGDRKTLAYVDTACSICWFIMDASWMLHVPAAAVAMAFPTIALALTTFAFVERTAASLFVTGAMLAWACMNVAWMLHDLGLIGPDGLAMAISFFITGAAQLFAALIAARFGRGSLEALMRRFRRMRIKR